MQVLLLDDLPALGAKGQTVDVPEGYAVNFLFPQHIAVPAPQEDVVAPAKRGRRPSMAGMDADARSADALEGEEITMPFAPHLTAAAVVKAFRAAGHKIEAAWLHLPQMPVAGSYELVVEFPSGLEARCTLTLHEQPV